MIVAPGITSEGSVCRKPVGLIDIYPTLLDLAGVPLRPEQHRDGRSYRAAMQGETYQRDPMFFHSALGRPAQTGDTRSSAVIDGDWKLIQWYSLEDESIERTELFNLENDPYEREDLHAREAGKTKELETILNHWKQSVNARLGKFKRGGI